jgi:hypothetical protein
MIGRLYGRAARRSIIAPTMLHRAPRTESRAFVPQAFAARRRPEPLGPALLALSLSVVAVLADVAARANVHGSGAHAARRFRRASRGAGLPQGMGAGRLTERKRLTSYALVRDAGNTVLHANAVGAASGLAQFTIFEQQ